MYYTILELLQDWLFGSAELVLWQESFLAILTITVITMFAVFLWNVVSGFISRIFRWN